MSPKLQQFWRWLSDVGGKKWAVLQGEFRLSRTAAAAGLRLRPLFSSRDSQARIRTYRELTALDHDRDVVAYREFLDRHFESADELNPTVYFADILIARERFPYLKRNMFLGHAAGVPVRKPWVDLIAEVSSYNPALMTGHRDALAAQGFVHFG